MPPPFDDGGDPTGYLQSLLNISTVDPIFPPVDILTPGHPGYQTLIPIPSDPITVPPNLSGGGGVGGGLSNPPDIELWILGHNFVLSGTFQRPPVNPINKSNGPDLNPGPNGCDPYDMAELLLALKTAQSIIREKIQELRDRLAPCDKDGRMTSLLDCIADEGLPYRTEELLSHIYCTDPIIDKFGTVFKEAEGFTYSDYDPIKKSDTQYNSIAFNLKKIMNDSANGDLKKFRDILSRDMLHELMHNCELNRGGGDKDMYPRVTELDVQVLTNMLGFPRDTKGIQGSTAYKIQILPENNVVMGERSKNKLNSAGPPWMNGNFFIWDPGSGRVLCSDNATTPAGTGTDWGGSAWHEIFGTGRGELPLLKKY